MLRGSLEASQMSLLVLLHVTRVTKTFAAVTAAKRLLSRVVAQMHSEVARLTEPLPTHRAAVGLLPRVHPAVLLVVARVPEGAAAGRAAVVFSDISLERSRAFCACLGDLLFFYSSIVCIVVSVGKWLVYAILLQTEDDPGLTVES